MTGKEIYKIWAPSNKKWVDWVRPVSFIQINDNYTTNQIFDTSIPKINYLDDNLGKIALIVDMPECESIREGIALSQKGFRPIPVFNGTINPKKSVATTDNSSIAAALIWGASILQNIKIDDDSSPAFLLNTDRMERYKVNEGVFDNSWDLYHQDLPTAEYFLNEGINKIVIRSKVIQKDLIKIFYKFQQKGVAFYHTDGYDKPKFVKFKKPKDIDKDF